MYSRSPISKDTQISIPENYDGTAFAEPVAAPLENTERSIKVVGSPSADVKMSPTGFTQEEPDTEPTFAPSQDSEEAGLFSGLFGRLPSLGAIFGERSSLTQCIKLPKFGIEELLIIGIALFLLFTKDGDKECAIMLLLLIFVGN